MHAHSSAVARPALGLLAALALVLSGCGGGNGSGNAAGTAASGAAATTAAGAPATPAAGAADGTEAGGGRARALAAARASEGGVFINEVVAGAWKGRASDYGSAEDWVELHNPAATPVDLSGYGLSNKSATPFLWAFPAGTTIPAKGYLTVWLSKFDRAELGRPLHANFNLDSGGDTVYLTASNATATGIAVDSAKPPLLAPDQSWCRMPDGGAASPFRVCVQPTFGAANAGPNFAGILARPALSLGSGFYAAAQTLTITGPAGATLRYTTDGSVPTAASAVYTQPLAISGARVVRAVAFADGQAPSLPATGTYVVDAAKAAQYQNLKAMMVTVPPADLAKFQANDREHDFIATFELITAATTSAFRVDAEASAGGGGGSDDSPLRTMNVAARDAFGVKSFPAALWPDKPGLTSTKKFRLRNGSNDWAAAHLRDQLAQKASVDGPNLTGASTSVAMFVNGTYYGLMDLREREDETLPAANLNIDKDYVDFLVNPLIPGQEIKNGLDAALQAYTAMHEFVTRNDMTVAANYARAGTLMNLGSFAWDWALHMFTANHDWPNNNTHVWRSEEYDGRWTWRPHDFDFAFGRYDSPARDMNDSFAMDGSQLVNALLRNATFRTLYLNTVADQMNLMTPAYLDRTLDGMAADMRPYIPDFYAAAGLGAPANWEAQLTRLRTHFAQREPYYDGHNRQRFGLGNRQPIAVSVSDPAMGTVLVNTLDTQRYVTAASPVWTGRYYPGVPISLQAQPKPGFAFVGWQGASTSTQRAITQTLAASDAGAVAADNFSVRWSGAIEAPAGGSAVLQTVADDGVRLWFDNTLVIDNWADQGPTPRSATVTFVAGRRHAIRLEYYERAAGAQVALNWQLPGTSGFVPVPAARLYADGAPASPAATGTGLTGRYFANTTLTGVPTLVRTEAVNFNWGLNAPVPAAVPLTLRAVFAPAGAPAAPTVSGVADALGATTGTVVKVQPTAVDPGGYPLTWSASGLPKGVSINARTGRIFGRVTTPGTYASVIKAGNGVSQGTLAVTWTISDRPGTGTRGTSPDSGNGGTPPANQPPTVAIGAPADGSYAAQGTAVTVSATAADADGTVVRVEFYAGSTLIGSPTAAPFSVSWTSPSAGTYALTARAFDDKGAATTSAPVKVIVVNTVPASTPPPASAIACANEFAVCALPAGATATVWFGADTRWTSRTGLTGNVACSSDTFGDPAFGTAKSCRYVVTSTPANQPPTVALTAPAGATSVAAGAPLIVSASAADADGRVAKVEFYDGATLLTSTATAPYAFQWSSTVVGPHALTARAIDDKGAASTSAPVTVTVTAPTPPAAGGLRADYFGNGTLTGSSLVRRVEAPNFDWSLGSPAPGLVPSDYFSMRWAGQVEAPVTGSYRLRTISDDGVKVWVDGRLLISNWGDHSATADTSPSLALAAGQRVNLVIEYRESTGYAQLRLQWQTPGSFSFAAVPAARLFPVLAEPNPRVAMTAMAGSTTLGAPFVDPVDVDQRTIGMALRADNVIHQARAINQPVALSPHGGNGGSASSVSWPVGEYLVGVRGNACTNGPIAQLSFITNTGRVMGPWGGSGCVGASSPFELRVPAGHQVLGLRGTAGTYLYAIGLVHGRR